MRCENRGIPEAKSPYMVVREDMSNSQNLKLGYLPSQALEIINQA